MKTERWREKSIKSGSLLIWIQPNFFNHIPWEYLVPQFWVCGLNLICSAVFVGVTCCMSFVIFSSYIPLFPMVPIPYCALWIGCTFHLVLEKHHRCYFLLSNYSPWTKKSNDYSFVQQKVGVVAFNASSLTNGHTAKTFFSVL